MRMATGIAKFPFVRTLEGFDCAAQPSLDPGQVRDLAACRWVANGDALLISGRQASARPRRSAWARGDPPRLRGAVRPGHGADHDPRARPCRGPARRPAGLLRQAKARDHRRARLSAFEPNAAHLFFQLGSRRYERGSLLLVTSNRSVGEWGEVFGDPVVATAILDRLLHHSHVVTIRGDSYRLRESAAPAFCRRPERRSHNSKPNEPLGSSFQWRQGSHRAVRVPLWTTWTTIPPSSQASHR